MHMIHLISFHTSIFSKSPIPIRGLSPLTLLCQFSHSLMKTPPFPSHWPPFNLIPAGQASPFLYNSHYHFIIFLLLDHSHFLILILIITLVFWPVAGGGRLIMRYQPNKNNIHPIPLSFLCCSL